MDKEIRQEINRLAYFLAQQQFSMMRRDLEVQCRELARAGKLAPEILKFLISQYGPQQETTHV